MVAPTTHALVETYEAVKSTLNSVLKAVLVNESGTNVESEMRSAIATQGKRTRNSKQPCRHMEHVCCGMV